MYGKKIFKKRNVTKLLAMLLAVICVAQASMPVDIEAANVNDYYEEETSDGRVLKVVMSGDQITEGRDYTMDDDGCVTLLESGVELLENGADGYVYGWDYNAICNMKSIILPDGMTRLNDYAFYSCYALENVTIPDSITYIGGCNTFGDCYKLKSITIPESVEGMVIDRTTFQNCTNLKTVTISGKGTTIKNYAFYYTTYNASMKATISSITINDADITLEPNAFYCTWIKKIVLPEGMTAIPDYAFSSCENLTSVNIPSTVKRIGAGAFANCSLTSITIPKNVTSIGDYAFYGCTSLKTVTFKKNTSTSKKLSIGSNAFEYCEKLASITIQRNIKLIKSNVFDHCDKLKKIIIKGNVDTIRSEAFTGIFGLERIIITGNVGKTGYIYSNGLGNPKKVEIRGTLGSGLKKIQADKIIVNGKVYKWADGTYRKLIYVGKE